MSTVGVQVRRARLSAGMTMAQLAGAVGHSQPYISMLESGERRFNEEVLEKIGRALGLRLSTLLAQDEHNVWQEGFDAGVAAARRALAKLAASQIEPADEKQEGQ